MHMTTLYSILSFFLYYKLNIPFAKMFKVKRKKREKEKDKKICILKFFPSIGLSSHVSLLCIQSNSLSTLSLFSEALYSFHIICQIAVVLNNYNS